MYRILAAGKIQVVPTIFILFCSAIVACTIAFGDDAAIFYECPLFLGDYIWIWHPVLALGVLALTLLLSLSILWFCFSISHKTLPFTTSFTTQGTSPIIPGSHYIPSSSPARDDLARHIYEEHVGFNECLERHALNLALEDIFTKENAITHADKIHKDIEDFKIRFETCKQVTQNVETEWHEIIDRLIEHTSQASDVILTIKKPFYYPIKTRLAYAACQMLRVYTKSSNLENDYESDDFQELIDRVKKDIDTE